MWFRSHTVKNHKGKFTGIQRLATTLSSDTLWRPSRCVSAILKSILPAKWANPLSSTTDYPIDKYTLYIAFLYNLCKAT